jgi:hypothetical protein
MLNYQRITDRYYDDDFPYPSVFLFDIDGSEWFFGRSKETMMFHWEKEKDP